MNDMNDMNKKNKKYKIGTVSKIFGIPLQTIRYYEDCGILSPQRNPDSNFRYYTTWDLNYLLDSKYMRSFEFTLPIVEEMINLDNLEEVEKKYSQQEKSLKEKARYYQALHDEIKIQQERISRISTDKSSFEICMSPELIFLVNRKNDEYYFGNSDHAKENNFATKFNEWIKFMPFVSSSFMISPQNMSDIDIQNIDYFTGLSITVHRKNELNLQLPTQYVTIPSTKSYYSIFLAHEKGTFLPNFKEQIIKPISKMGFQITGNTFGRIITRIHEDGEFKRYFEVWVPIQETNPKNM